MTYDTKPPTPRKPVEISAELARRGDALSLEAAVCIRDFVHPNPCAKILDHKWLDPVCVENGCQSLVNNSAAQELDSLRNFFDQTEGKSPTHVAGHAIRVIEEFREAERRLSAKLDAVRQLCRNAPWDATIFARQVLEVVGK